ncbi:MAG: AAA family ATPase [Bdellovibrionales bacterium RIFOXYC1_FULL_54_43]|nr:MAG: AAA family ATPase [Bdellovibrionales bacterium RIFOXYC1_FULL_54_43]OFZ83979.1 MAG: AAA family ATPase [Bdellovibrionales bacterium RIFOXYD1_FULL_55_31]
MFKRSSSLISKPPKRSFFLWGPRQTGKTSLLRAAFPDALWIDLLHSDQFVKYQRDPSFLRQELSFEQNVSKPRLIIVDEIQKVPGLLDEIHWLIENRKFAFGLCGSSARKLRRGHANLLGGRADRFELFGLVSQECGPAFDLGKFLNYGYLPSIFLSETPGRSIRSYCADYLKEEIAAEGLVRNLPAFSNFLEVAALGDTEQINYSTIARDCGVSSPTVKSYFEVLVDTLMAAFLPAFTKRPKRRIMQVPKLYFSDIGVVNFLAKRAELKPGSELFGKAFENWVFHELTAHRAYTEAYYDLSYWRLSTGVEVDFIIGNMEFAIEAKASAKVTQDHLKGLRELKKDHQEIKRRYLVCLEKMPRQTDDGITILPYGLFAEKLWKNDLLR